MGDLLPASTAPVGPVRYGLALKVLERMELRLYRRAAAVVALTGELKDKLQTRVQSTANREVRRLVATKATIQFKKLLLASNLTVHEFVLLKALISSSSN